MMTDDEKYMRRALTLAKKALGDTAPNPMVGAVIVRSGKVIGEGWHHRAGLPHAEIEAINSVSDKRLLRGAAIYVTLEPCSTTGRTPPCVDAIIRHGFKRVVSGCADPNPKHAGRGLAILEKAGIKTECGVLERECLELNAPFFKYITTGTPLVLLKMASTIDGKTATASGSSKWITGVRSRARVQRLRREAGAVMVGANTLKADSPSLTVRDKNGKTLKTPLRFVASSNKGIVLPDGWERISLPDAPAWKDFLLSLGGRGVMLLLIEGGSELASSALNAGIVDRIEFHFAPKILGGRGSIPSVGGADPLLLDDAFQLEDMKISRHGGDFSVTAKVIERKNKK